MNDHDAHDPGVPAPEADPVRLLRRLLDREAVVEATNAMAAANDARDWPALRGCFAETIDLDYTTLAGGVPERLTADVLVARWRTLAEGFAATHHLVGNHRVVLDGDEAECTAAFLATHLLPGDLGGATWTIGGSYRYRLARIAGIWRIRAVAMAAAWGAGNRHLLALAATRGVEVPTPPTIQQPHHPPARHGGSGHDPNA